VLLFELRDRAAAIARKRCFRAWWRRRHAHANDRGRV